jgi:hypothetical protein
MTTFLAAEKAMLAEVEGRIIDLVPEREATTRFSKRTDADRELEDFDDDQGVPRLFEIGAPLKGQNRYVGYDARAYWYRYPLTIHYPALGQHWNGAALSDAERIAHDLLRNPTTSDGVQSRRIDPDEQEILEHDEDDPWMILRMTLLVLYEVTGT